MLILDRTKSFKQIL